MLRPGLFSTLLLLVPLACGEPDDGQDLDPQTLYRAAVEDAAVVDADEVVDDLVAIRPGADDIVEDAEGRVLMVTWTDWDGYDGKEDQAMELGVEVWATAAPHLQQTCRTWGLDGDALTGRLEQRLGLPPGGAKDRVVELWVAPEAMFRPSPDPAIDDASADLEFPADASQDHIAWIEALRAASYGDDGYPWTQLGYTYDWAPGATSEVGDSEFVVRAGSEVVVASVTPQADYCK
jgi:hypothetical protein